MSMSEHFTISNPELRVAQVGRIASLEHTITNQNTFDQFKNISSRKEWLLVHPHEMQLYGKPVPGMTIECIVFLSTPTWKLQSSLASSLSAQQSSITRLEAIKVSYSLITLLRNRALSLAVHPPCTGRSHAQVPCFPHSCFH